MAFFLGHWDDALRSADDFIAECEAGSPHYLEPAMRDTRGLIRLALDDVRMALGLPSVDGIGVMEAIRSEFPGSRFIALTVYQGDEDIHRALAAGAQGYLLKSAPPSQLVGAIRAVAAGLRRIPPEIASRLSDRGPGAGLTAREIEVLKLVAKGRTNVEIARELSITSGTAKWFVSNILSKLGVDDRTEAVTTALERGILHG